MATSVDIRNLIDRANAQIALINILLGANRPQFIQRIVYLGATYYLQSLVENLEQINDTILAAIADLPLPTAPEYELIEYSENTFDFQIQTTNEEIELLQGKITYVEHEVGEETIVDTYIWLPTVIFGAFTNLPLPQEQLETRFKQAQYAYLALRIAWDINDPPFPLDIKMLLAILYRGELGTDSNNDIRLQALTRSFFDPNSACGGDLSCNSYDDIVLFLRDSSFWFNRTQTVDVNGDVTPFGAYARVRIDGIIGGQGLLEEAHIGTLQDDYNNNRGPFAVDGHIQSIFVEHIDWLRNPGQRLNRPSRWGNFLETPQLAARLEGKIGDQIRQEVEDFLQEIDEGFLVYDVALEQVTPTCRSVFIVVNAMGIPNLGTC